MRSLAVSRSDEALLIRAPRGAASNDVRDERGEEGKVQAAQKKSATVGSRPQQPEPSGINPCNLHSCAEAALQRRGRGISRNQLRLTRGRCFIGGICTPQCRHCYRCRRLAAPEHHLPKICFAGGLTLANYTFSRKIHLEESPEKVLPLPERNVIVGSLPDITALNG